MLVLRWAAAAVAVLVSHLAAQQPDRPRVVFLVGESEYGSEQTMPELARRLRGALGADVTMLRRDRRGHLPALDDLDRADLLVMFLRFCEAEDAQVERLTRWIAAGKPTIALRTTSHAFRGRQGWFPPLFGGHYKAHADNELGTIARVSDAAAEHPVTQGLPRLFECGEGGTYDAQPLSDGARVLLFGRSGDLPSQPIAWTYREAAGARLFYTSLGSREHMAQPEVHRLLENAAAWCLGRTSLDPLMGEPAPPPPPPERAPPPGATVLFDGQDVSSWRHWDPSEPPRAIELDEAADTTEGGPGYAAARWTTDSGALVARPGFGDIVTKERFGNYQLHLDFWLPREHADVTGDFRGASGVYLGGRHEIQIRDSHGWPLTDTSCGAVFGQEPPEADAAWPAGMWQSLDVRFRHEQGYDPVATVWLNGVLVQDAVELSEPTVYGFMGGEDGAVQQLRGLRRAWMKSKTPDLSDGGFAFVARFRSRGDGTLVAKAPPTGNWAANGKTLFLRGGRLVYDIGWVGALTSRARFDDGEWHTVVLAHEDNLALMYVDGELEGTREDFVSEDNPEHVLKVGATSPNFGGPLLAGRIAEVMVFDRPLGRDRAREISGGHVPERQPVVSWQPAPNTEVEFAEQAEGAVVMGPIRLQADCSEVRFANVWVRPLVEVDHRALISSLDQSSFERGRQLYSGMCVACHGADGEKTVHPQARAFSVAEMQNGADPLSLFQTLTAGFRTMPPQTWMTPEQRYDVVHYLREEFLREGNPSQYVEVTDEWLAALPAALPELSERNSVVAGDDDGLPARDFGPGLISQIGGAVPAGLTVRLPGDISLGYDLHTMSTIDAWRGGFLELSATHHYRQRGEGIARKDGESLRGLDTWEWAFGETFDLPDNKPPRGPVPSPQLQRHGHHVIGRDVVLSYAINGRDVLEWPTSLSVGGQIALMHTLHVAPGEAPLRLAVAKLAGIAQPAQPASGEVTVAGAWRDGVVGVFVAAAARGDLDDVTSQVDDDGRIVFTIPSSERARELAIVRAAGRGQADLDGFRRLIERTRGRPVPDLVAMTGDGEVLWPEVVVTRGTLGDARGAYTVDTLPLPTDNPWGAWLRTSALGCFEDGRVAVSTLGGDVWLVDGVDADLDELRWKRFATGMFEPLGLEVVDGKVLVTCRDGVIRLHDRNGDGEADYYESFFADPDVTASFHAFNFDLQRDTKGNLYYVKSGRYTKFPLPGAVMALPPEGKSHRVFATGFRTPNGMGILPDDSLLVSDNQGNWVPASKVSRIREGGFYGVFSTSKQERDDFDRPLLWLPQEVDSSSGGQLWVDDPRFGPLSGHLLHTSFGKGWVYALALQEVNGATQSSCVTLPFQFDAGVQRARVNPADGQVYVAGLSGWQGPAEGDDGCLQRLRYTGAPETRLLSAKATHDGVELKFSGPLAAGAAELENYQAERWDYRWTAAYGSAQYSVGDPDREGRDTMAVTGARMSSDMHTVRLTLADMRPCDQLKVRCLVPAGDGTTIRDTVHMTLHALPPR